MCSTKWTSATWRVFAKWTETACWTWICFGFCLAFPTSPFALNYLQNTEPFSSFAGSADRPSENQISLAQNWTGLPTWIVSPSADSEILMLKCWYWCSNAYAESLMLNCWCWWRSCCCWWLYYWCWCKHCSLNLKILYSQLHKLAFFKLDLKGIESSSA